MVRTQKEANKTLNHFENELDNLILEHLVGEVTKGQMNEYYGWANDCQLAEMLQEAEELDELLKTRR
uniref:Uncharacterized protein n=1 Tax=viral metagenome TaxID=1070528 RepID=A0A6M3Y6V2_9ZZZZ